MLNIISHQGNTNRTTMIDHLTSIMMAKIKKTTVTRVGKHKLELSHIADRMYYEVLQPIWKNFSSSLRS